MYLKIIYFKKNIRVLPFFSLKHHYNIRYRAVKSVNLRNFRKLALKWKNGILPFFIKKKLKTIDETGGLLTKQITSISY